MMERLTFTNARGESVVIDGRPYRLINMTGIGASDTDVQMQKAPYQDGKTLIDTLLEERYIEIEISIWRSNQEEVYESRAELTKIFNPKLGEGVLIYEYDGGAKEIKCVPETAPHFPTGATNRAKGYQRALVTFVCPSPFWLDNFESSQELAVFIGLFHFPLELPTQMGEQGEKVVINNDGGVPTPVTIEFNGPALNPVVRNNTTGEFVRVNRGLDADQTLIINTEFGNKSVDVINHTTGEVESAFHLIDIESTFWQLIVGPNEVEYAADVGADNARVIVKYRKRYVGV